MTEAGLGPYTLQIQIPYNQKQQLMYEYFNQFLCSKPLNILPTISLSANHCTPSQPLLYHTNNNPSSQPLNPNSTITYSPSQRLLPISAITSYAKYYYPSQQLLYYPFQQLLYTHPIYYSLPIPAITLPVLSILYNSPSHYYSLSQSLISQPKGRRLRNKNYKTQTF